VTQTLRPIPNESAFGEDYNVELLHEPHSHRPSDSDGRSITALSWIELSTHNVKWLYLFESLIILMVLQLILVHCKPGVVHLWSAFPLAQNAPLPWSDSREIHLQTQRVSIGSSSLYPVSGMMYIRSSDALILCLFDGSFHTIHRLASDPSYLPQDSSSSLISEKLSTTSRSIFAQAEMRNIQSSDVNRTSGMMSYDGFSTVAWAHEYVSFIHSFNFPIDLCDTGRVDRQTLAISTRRNTIACLSLHSCGTTFQNMPLQIISHKYL
jgi:general transcription factor 3C protein 4